MRREIIWYGSGFLVAILCIASGFLDVPGYEWMSKINLIIGGLLLGQLSIVIVVDHYER